MPRVGVGVGVGMSTGAVAAASETAAEFVTGTGTSSTDDTDVTSRSITYDCVTNSAALNDVLVIIVATDGSGESITESTALTTAIGAGDVGTFGASFRAFYRRLDATGIVSNDTYTFTTSTAESTQIGAFLLRNVVSTGSPIGNTTKDESSSARSSVGPLSVSMTGNSAAVAVAAWDREPDHTITITPNGFTTVHNLGSTFNGNVGLYVGVKSVSATGSVSGPTVSSSVGTDEMHAQLIEFSA